jgi:pimeloyl-ACP methyl ester carboxylesterase
VVANAVLGAHPLLPPVGCHTVLTSFDGGRLFGELYGKGQPRVLALHGWRRDHRDWSAVLSDVPGSETDGEESSARALGGIALDLPGFGATPPPEKPWGSGEYADAVAGVLEEMETPIVVVGHSFGGRVATLLAAGHPHLVAGLVLTGAPLFPAHPGARQAKPPTRLRAAKLLSRSGLISADRLEATKRRYGSEDYRAATGVMRDILVRLITETREEAYSPSLRKISCPTELVWGALDTAAPVVVAERIASELGGPTELRVIADVGHLTPELAPSDLRAAIGRLLGERVN